MEPEGSLPSSQEPFTGPYPKPDQSSRSRIILVETYLLLGPKVLFRTSTSFTAHDYSSYCLPFASISSLSALLNHPLHLPAISIWAFPLFFHLLAYSEALSKHWIRMYQMPQSL
jgi:hypothetical protein